MITIYGKYTNAIVYTVENELYALEDYARKQLQMICNHPSSEGSIIRVMPDVHPGKVGTIGLTMTVGDSILPSLVGVDIGCGMTIAKIKTKGIQFQQLDSVIRDNVPVGPRIRREEHKLQIGLICQSLVALRALMLLKQIGVSELLEEEIIS